MKMVALADPVRRSEIHSKNMKDGVEWIWVDSISDMAAVKKAYAYVDLAFSNDSERISGLAKLLPSPVIIDAVPYSLKEIGHPFIRLNGWPGFIGRPVCEIAVKEGEAKGQAKDVFDSLGWTCRIVPDLPGMISPRIIAMIINEAFFTYEAGISTKKDIDRAMKLGTNYPYGPFEWAGIIGLHRIFELLSVLSNNDHRYTISEALKSELNQRQ